MTSGNVTRALALILAVLAGGCVGTRGSTESTETEELGEPKLVSPDEGDPSPGALTSPQRVYVRSGTIEPGGDDQGPHPDPWQVRMGPHPDPWEPDHVTTTPPSTSGSNTDNGNSTDPNHQK